MTTFCRATFIAAALLTVTPARAADPPHGPITLRLGIGRNSCAFWTRENIPSIQDWIMGFWSGMNLANNRNHTVGIQTDAVGILAAVKKICDGDPSIVIANATEIVYGQIFSEGR